MPSNYRTKTDMRFRSQAHYTQIAYVRTSLRQLLISAERYVQFFAIAFFDLPSMAET